jgi:capreomycidine synthase
MTLPPFLLEDWFRRYYFRTRWILCSSGVEEFTFGELRSLLGLAPEALDAIRLDDSPSFGDNRLRQAIADRYASGSPDRVLVTHGSSEALFLIFHALLEPGDEVVVVSPAYQSLRALPPSIGCEVRHWPLRAENGFEADMSDLKRAVSHRTRMIVASFPNNPTGSTLSAAQFRELIQIAAAAGTYLLWDGAFHDLVYDEPALPNPAALYDRAVVTGTLSKGYGLPGLRVGWCIAEPRTLQAAVQIRDYLTLNLSPLVEFIAAAAVENLERVAGVAREHSVRNLATVRSWVTQHSDFVAWSPPKGGVSSFLRLTQIDDEVPFCRRLAEDSGVLLLPGQAFDHAGYVRLGFGKNSAALGQGLEIVGKALAYEHRG